MSGLAECVVDGVCRSSLRPDHVVPLLENHIRPTPSRPLQRPLARNGEFSRRKVPNVVADSSAKSRKGFWAINRKTESSRYRRAIKAINEWCRANRHLKIREQHCKLRQKIQGHYNYYGITSNGAMLKRFWEACKRIWRNWLARRSRKAYRNWAWFVELLKRYPLPTPVVVRSVYRR